jgi:hypothetical protein
LRVETENPPSTGTRAAIAVFLAAVTVVATLSVLSNRMRPRWDSVYYLDMATSGLAGNHHLVAPFAYRPIAPLTIGAIARTLHMDPVTTFRAGAHVAALALLLVAYYFMRRFGASEFAAGLGTLAIALNFVMIRYPLFNGTMLDIYAYPFVLLGFWGVLRRRFYPVLLLCAVGLFLKEFMLLPLLAQAGVLVLETPRKRWLSLWLPLGLTGMVIAVCFIAPRAVIPVVDSFQDIDPHIPGSLRRLITHPLSWRRWFNIVYSYLAFWLPCALLMTRDRWQMVRRRLAPYSRAIGCFAVFHLLLVLYGGTNIFVFTSYSLPVELLVLVVLLDQGAPQLWELILVFAVLVIFNRIGAHIPVFEEGWDNHLDFYGGYSSEIRLRSVLRFAEVLAYVGAFQILRRALAARLGPRVRLVQ